MSNGLLRLKGSRQGARSALLQGRSIPDHGESERAQLSFLISDDPLDQDEPMALARSLSESVGARLTQPNDSGLQKDPLALLMASGAPRAPNELMASTFSVLSTPLGARFELDGVGAAVSALSAQSMFEFLQAKARAGQSAADSVFIIHGLAEAIGSFATPEESRHIATAMSALLSPKIKAPLVVSAISSAAFDQLNSADGYPMFMRQSARCFELPGASADLSAVSAGSAVSPISVLKNLSARRDRSSSTEPIAYSGAALPPRAPSV